VSAGRHTLFTPAVALSVSRPQYDNHYDIINYVLNTFKNSI